MAKEAGIAVGTLRRLESEGAIQPGFFTVGAVAEALAVSLDDLFRAARVPPITPGLWSAGYEGRDIDSFVTSLVESRISVVADVRLTPISRKKGFSKTRLGEALAEADIEYIHLRGLGNPKDNRAPFWEGRLVEGRAKFRGVMRSDEARSDLNRLAVHARQSEGRGALSPPSGSGGSPQASVAARNGVGLTSTIEPIGALAGGECLPSNRTGANR
ncbi:DUF488 family protein [Streptomyces sp. NBC_01506]|uniref:DUF488 family protein n=1 Tax=Streptomyces sp. NBC_01506 TaxID=2903887 RepID=UPI00386AC4D4